MKKITSNLWIIVVIAIFSYAIFKIVKNQNTDKQLEKRQKNTTRAIIINERNYMGNSPVSHEFSYSYQFVVNGKSYKGNSENSSLKVGDSINIEYVKDDPTLNRPSN